mmetsp:Transcript_5281/g.11571  ORF Transcript_5281/g.11571 Transcript_5281/m.11571 type:complete len:142 (-) Transcript_5281:1170-1595(-)
MSSTSSRTAGPRAVLKNEKYLRIAKATMEKERLKIWEQQNDSPHEKYKSTAESAQTHARERLMHPSCLDVSSDIELKEMSAKVNREAVTYWSHELACVGKPHFPLTPLKRGSPLFSKCTSFTNPIEDSRLQHCEAHERLDE